MSRVWSPFNVSVSNFLSLATGSAVSSLLLFPQPHEIRPCEIFPLHVLTSGLTWQCPTEVHCYTHYRNDHALTMFWRFFFKSDSSLLRYLSLLLFLSTTTKVLFFSLLHVLPIAISVNVDDGDACLDCVWLNKPKKPICWQKRDKRIRG